MSRACACNPFQGIYLGTTYASKLGKSGKRKDHTEEQVHRALQRSKGVPQASVMLHGSARLNSYVRAA